MQKYSQQDVNMILRVLAELCFERISSNPNHVEIRNTLGRQENLFICFQAMIDQNGEEPPQQMRGEDFLAKFAYIDFYSALSYVGNLNVEQKDALENFTGYILQDTLRRSFFGNMTYLFDDDHQIARKILQSIGKTDSILY